jgi:hypothetical protein
LQAKSYKNITFVGSMFGFFIPLLLSPIHKKRPLVVWIVVTDRKLAWSSGLKAY